jgi:hypothetical protein
VYLAAGIMKLISEHAIVDLSSAFIETKKQIDTSRN